MMAISLRHIFGCSHSQRKIHSKVIFENGLEVPATFCEDCVEDTSIKKFQ